MFVPLGVGAEDEFAVTAPIASDVAVISAGPVFDVSDALNLSTITTARSATG